MPDDYSTPDSSSANDAGEWRPAAAPTETSPSLAHTPEDTPAAETPAGPPPSAALEPAGEPETPPEAPIEPEAGPPGPQRRGRRGQEVAGLGGEPANIAAGPPLSLVALVESLLFVADGPVPIARLAEALEVSAREVEAAVAELAASHEQRGLSLQRFRDRVQLTTAPAAAASVERFLGLAATAPLSKAALETLAIVAYQQPVTRPQIDAVRGVNSDSVIKTLLSKGLIEEGGRAEGPGRPVLYSTTPEFMQHFGLSALGELPPLALPESQPQEPRAPADHEGVLKG